MKEQQWPGARPFDLGSLKEIVGPVFPQSDIVDVVALSSSSRSINLEITTAGPELGLNLRVFVGEDAQTRAQKEEYFCRLIGQETDVVVPTVYLRDNSRQLVDGALVLESKLPGVKLGEVCGGLTEGEQKSLAFQLGGCLAQIHSIKLEKYGDRFEGGRLGQFLSWKDYFLQSLRRKLAWCSQQRLISVESRNLLASYVEERGWIFDIQSPPCLVHQDLHLGNVKALLTPAGRWVVSGIYDFEDGISGHNEWDFAKPNWAIFSRYPAMKGPMLAGYLERGLLSDEFEERLELYRVAESIDFWVFGTKTGLSDEVDRSIKRTIQQIEWKE